MSYDETDLCSFIKKFFEFKKRWVKVKGFKSGSMYVANQIVKILKVDLWTGAQPMFKSCKYYFNENCRLIQIF